MPYSLACAGMRGNPAGQSSAKLPETAAGREYEPIPRLPCP